MYMKKKIFALLALVMTAMTASAIDAPSYNLTVGENAQGTVKFYVAETEVTKAPEGATVTVVITPNTGWVVNQPSGQWYAAVAKAPRRTAGIDMLKDFDLTKLLGQDNTWSFVMQRANAEISVTYKKLLTNQDITIDDITALTYTGQAQEPVVTVKDGSVVLTKDVDYTVAYSNNTNAALATAAQNAPTVTITAVATSDKYAGETTKKFTINKKALTVTADNKSVTFGDDAPTYTESYDGFVNNETKAVLSGTLAFACDYVKNQSGAGNYDITPSGLTSSNYDITFTKGTLTVGKKALESSMIATIDPLTYTGQALTPEPVVTFNGMTLVKGTDYTVSYGTNGNAGTGTVTITAVASSQKYAGTATKEFKINQAQGSVYFYPMKYEKTFGDEDFTVEPTMVTGDGTLFFWSKNEDVATVDSETGLVHIVGTGIAYIHAVMEATTNFTSASDYYVLTVKPKEIEYASGDITQDGNGYTVNLTEDEDHPNADPLPDDADLSNLTYQRELTAPGSGSGDGSGDIIIDEQPANMYTVCLPFAPKKDAAVKYYTLSSVVGETLVFDEVADAQSHTPYLVAVFGDVNVREDCSDLDVSSMTINSTTVDGYTFNGTFTGKKNADALGLYILQRNMQWGKVTSGSVYIPPFRAYIEATSASTRKTLDSNLGDNTTGLKNIRTVDNDGTERWYDLNGHRIEKPATKGVYIQDGRKILVK